MFERINNDYQAAADLFRKALETDPEHTKSKVALSETLLRMGDAAQARKLLAGISAAKDWWALLNAGRTLYDTKRWKDSKTVLSRALELLEQEKDTSKGLIAAAVKEVREKLIVAGAKTVCVGFAEEIRDLSPEDQVERVQAKYEELGGRKRRYVGGIEIKDGKWIGAGLSHDVRFLDPLRGLPLQHLTMSHTKVRDLEPLKGMPLTYLSCFATPIKSLEPLVEGMPLTTLSCYSTRVNDLTPLKGKPLKELHCGDAPITDLSPLKGMPLVNLSFPITPVSDLGPLKGMRLVRLNCSNTHVTDLGPLKGIPLTYLSCGNIRVRDLSPLKGMLLTNLVLGGTKVVDLSPLEGMPLTHLNMIGTQVADLSPLKGMPLQDLNLAQTNVADLSPLKGMGLKILWIRGSKVTDLTPLEGMKLEAFIFTPIDITKGIEIVRSMKSMQRIGLENGLAMDPEEFWKKYDAGEFD